MTLDDRTRRAYRAALTAAVLGHVASLFAVGAMIEFWLGDAPPDPSEKWSILLPILAVQAAPAVLGVVVSWIILVRTAAGGRTGR